MECQLLQQIRESDPINTVGARVIPVISLPLGLAVYGDGATEVKCWEGCSWLWERCSCASHPSSSVGRQREPVLTLLGWLCSLSSQHGGMDVLLPQTNAALAGISSFQLIPLQPMDLGSVGSKESSVGTAVSLAQPLCSGCRSFSSSSSFPKGEKRIL